MNFTQGTTTALLPTEGPTLHSLLVPSPHQHEDLFPFSEGVFQPGFDGCCRLRLLGFEAPATPVSPMEAHHARRCAHEASEF